MSFYVFSESLFIFIICYSVLTYKLKRTSVRAGPVIF